VAPKNCLSYTLSAKLVRPLDVGSGNELCGSACGTIKGGDNFPLSALCNLSYNDRYPDSAENLTRDLAARRRIQKDELYVHSVFGEKSLFFRDPERHLFRAYDGVEDRNLWLGYCGLRIRQQGQDKAHDSGPMRSQSCGCDVHIASTFSKVA
jgi:hypothetical protein